MSGVFRLAVGNFRYAAQIYGKRYFHATHICVAATLPGRSAAHAAAKRPEIVGSPKILVI